MLRRSFRETVTFTLSFSFCAFGLAIGVARGDGQGLTSSPHRMLPVAPRSINSIRTVSQPSPHAGDRPSPVIATQTSPARHGGHRGGYGHGFGPGYGFVPFGFTPNLIVVAPGGGFYGGPAPGPIALPPQTGGGLMLPQPLPPDTTLQQQPRPVPARPDPAKADGLVTIGDRLFRAGNLRRAEERYAQARRTNPNSATPLIRLAQLSLVRGDYQLGADQIRAAMIAEPGWLVNALDIQAVFAEPADFAKAIAKLESHLQKTPKDRNAWLVLGTELYLAGKTRQAADVFTRLNDRKPDATLAALIDATTPDPPPKP